MAKKSIEATFKLQVAAGAATAAPPVGPAFGQRGLNSMEFCKAFNAQTQDLPGVEKGTKLPVLVTAYSDRTFTFVIKSVPASTLLIKTLKLAKGSSVPNKDKVGTVTRAQLEEIAKMKERDLTAADIDAAVRTIAGTARSMGINVEGEV